MTPAALGVQMHSGWGVMVAVSVNPLEILARRRIVAADSESPGSIQPFHFAAGLPPAAQEEHIARCAETSSRLAAAAVAEAIQELRRYRFVAAAVLFASGRTLPALGKILAAHPLIHTAEGEFFRQAAVKALEKLQIPTTAIREKELEQRAIAVLGKKAGPLRDQIYGMGNVLGPPWTRDHKTAALAAALLLS
jgi:hypothetical protein